MTNERINPLKLAIGLVIEYFRWSQLTPMITFWAFGLLMLAALVFVNNQEASWTALESVLRFIAGLPLVGDAFVRWMESHAGEDGSIDLDGQDFKATALKAWGVLALAFMVLGLIAGRLFGPFAPWSLKRKLGVAALACLALLAGFVAVYWLDRELFNGPAVQWMLIFGAIAGLLALCLAETGSRFDQPCARLSGWLVQLANHVTGIHLEKIGGPCRTRTYDQKIKSLLLYQLS
jgi:hypothetical protein